MPGFLDYSADNLWGTGERIRVGINMFRKFRTVLAAAAFIVATYAAAAEMSGAHPDTYVVKRGDTLWDISGKFLKKPWLWPEIWQANPQIKNPHLIYPGDVISLAYLDRVALQPGPRQEAPIGAIPLSDIEPFLKNLRVTDSFEQLPRVVGLEEDRLRSSGGQLVYTVGLEGAQVGQRFAIVRPTLRYTHTRFVSNGRYATYKEDLDFRGERVGSQTIDWERNWNSAALDTGPQLELLGYELAQVSVGTLTRGVVPGSDASTLAPGRQRPRSPRRRPPDPGRSPALRPAVLPARAQGTAARRQASDRSSGRHALTSGGPRDVVAISGGSREGIDNGTVFSIWRQGSHVIDRQHDPEDSRLTETRPNSRTQAGGSDHVLPDEYRRPRHGVPHLRKGQLWLWSWKAPSRRAWAMRSSIRTRPTDRSGRKLPMQQHDGA